MDPAAFDPGPLADVSAEERDGVWTVMFVRDLPHPPERVWAALTAADQLPQWAPFEVDRDLGTTGAATLTMVDGTIRQAMASDVRVAEPPTRLVYTWGDDLLVWELSPTAGGTRLMLHHTVQGKDWMPKVVAGWHLCLVVADHMLAGDPIGPIVGGDAMRYGWQDLHDAYAALLGVAPQ